jgi:hypothetical protein
VRQHCEVKLGLVVRQIDGNGPGWCRMDRAVTDFLSLSLARCFIIEVVSLQDMYILNILTNNMNRILVSDHPRQPCTADECARTGLRAEPQI